jgi:predicted homoserine dehydrogenase-like protein
MIKVGVIGAGHLGRIHLQQLKNIAAYELMSAFTMFRLKERLL